jgi:hypothetical protein
MSEIHAELALGRWQEMTLAEQMANIGSEVSRAIKWQNKNNEPYFLRAFDRLHDLVYMTIEAVTIESHLRELTRLREMLNDYFVGENEFHSSPENFLKYFDQFAIRHRRQRTL